ncbi:hypothetical protein Pyn_38172 [Prunus yedoensis var. nudiflora]|uniref:Uncharacterized protein n=1 Tax=Prunus yedoensis var. nudiflora TaxID=2094558 RepID=A0A314ZTU6_PRUYE|nr:hypothetical protein Pyn_38172 [Prunus yedoensis var. nudiflora]
MSAENKNLPCGAFWLNEDHDGMLNLIEINSARQDSFNWSSYSKNWLMTVDQLLAGSGNFKILVPGSEIFYSLNATIVGLVVNSQGSKDLPWCVGLGELGF